MQQNGSERHSAPSQFIGIANATRLLHSYLVGYLYDYLLGYLRANYTVYRAGIVLVACVRCVCVCVYVRNERL